jgi:hypothetical protein
VPFEPAANFVTAIAAAASTFAFTNNAVITDVAAPFVTNTVFAAPGVSAAAPALALITVAPDLLRNSPSTIPAIVNVVGPFVSIICVAGNTSVLIAELIILLPTRIRYSPSTISPAAKLVGPAVSRIPFAIPSFDCETSDP